MVRQVNFSNDFHNRASLTISAAMYERKALDCSSILPLIISLNNLAYLVANNRKIRDMVCVDGGLERLLRILKDVPRNPSTMPGYNRTRPHDSVLPMWKWTTAFQCMVHLCIRGGITVRERAVEAGIVPILVKVLESYLCFSDALRNEKKKLVEERRRNENRAKINSDRRRAVPDLRQQFQIDAAEPSTSQDSVPAHRPTSNTAWSSGTRHDSGSNSNNNNNSNSIASASASNSLASPHQVASPVRSRTSAQDRRARDPTAAGTNVSSLREFNSRGSNDPSSTTSRTSTTTPGPLSSSRTSSSASQRSYESAQSNARFLESRPDSSSRSSLSSAAAPTPTGPWETASSINSPSTIASTLASSSASIVPTESASVSSAGTVESRSLTNASSAEDLREGGSASGSEGAEEEAEMSADGDDPAEDSEADVPMHESHTVQARNEDFTREVQAAAARAADQSDEEEPEERRTPRASRRSLAPLTTSQRPTHANQASSPSDWIAHETPRAPAMNSRSQTITPRGGNHLQANSSSGIPSASATSFHHHHPHPHASGSRHGHQSASTTSHHHQSQQPQQSSSNASGNHHEHSRSEHPQHPHSHQHHSHGRDRHSGATRIRPVLPTTYIAETFDPNDMAFREEEVLLSLQILAYLTKYSHIRALLRFPEMTRASNLQDLDELWEKAQSSPGTPMWQEGETFQRSIYTIAERYTCRATRRDPNAEYIAGHAKLAPLIQYWAAVVMRNACRKDDRQDDPRAGLRQCGNMLCGKWEREPREFAKCRRCKKAKFCSKVCQSTSWQIGHKYWCSSLGEDAEADRNRALRSQNVGIAGDQQDGRPAVEPSALTTTMEGPMRQPTTGEAQDVGHVGNAHIIDADAHVNENPAARPEPETTPRLASRSSNDARVSIAPRHNTGDAQRIPQINEPAPSPHSGLRGSMDDHGRRRMPSTLPSAIPSRIVSEATSAGAMSDMSEDEGDRSQMAHRSDDNISESERDLLRGPPPAPIRTDIAGRPLPPPVIAGTGMDLAAGQGINGAVGLDGDDSFGDRMLGGLDEQFGQGNIDQIPWRGQTPTQEMEGYNDTRNRASHRLFNQSNSNATTEDETDNEEPAVSRRRGTVTQAIIPAAVTPSAPVHEQQDQQSPSLSQRRSGSGLDTRHPGLGLPSHLSAGGPNRSASALHPMSSTNGGRSFAHPHEISNSVRRVPSSDHPVGEHLYNWYGPSGPRPDEQSQPGSTSWGLGTSRGQDMPAYTTSHGQSALNHHQRLLMRGDMAAGMMGRSATPPNLSASTAGNAGSLSAMSSPAGRPDDGRHVLPQSMSVDDQATPLSERHDPMDALSHGNSPADVRSWTSSTGDGQDSYTSSRDQQHRLPHQHSFHGGQHSGHVQYRQYSGESHSNAFSDRPASSASASSSHSSNPIHQHHTHNHSSPHYVPNSTARQHLHIPQDRNTSRNWSHSDDVEMDES
ncbi:unnamed protein product [Sympodiomycopsis kandeliae]